MLTTHPIRFRETNPRKPAPRQVNHKPNCLPIAQAPAQRCQLVMSLVAMDNTSLSRNWQVPATKDGRNDSEDSVSHLCMLNARSTSPSLERDEVLSEPTSFRRHYALKMAVMRMRIRLGRSCNIAPEVCDPSQPFPSQDLHPPMEFRWNPLVGYSLCAWPGKREFREETSGRE